MYTDNPLRGIILILNSKGIFTWNLFLPFPPCRYSIKLNTKNQDIYPNAAHFISSPGQRPSELLPSLGICRPSIVRRKLFQKSSPLKLLDQLKPNLVWIITRVSSLIIVFDDAVHQPTWPLLLKIEHGKIAGFWVITQKPLIISEIWYGVKIISTARSTYSAIFK